MNVLTGKGLLTAGAMFAAVTGRGYVVGEVVDEAAKTANLDTRGDAPIKVSSVDEAFELAWNNAADWRKGGDTDAGAPVATVTVEQMDGDAAAPTNWVAVGAPRTVVSSKGEDVRDEIGHLVKGLYRFTLAARRSTSPTARRSRRSGTGRSPAATAARGIRRARGSAAIADADGGAIAPASVSGGAKVAPGKSGYVAAADAQAQFGMDVTRTTTDGSNLARTMLSELTDGKSSSSSWASTSSGGTSSSSGTSTSGSTSSQTFSDNTSRGGTHDSTKVSGTSTGFTGTLSADTFKLALSAFEKVEDAKVFSNPKIIVSNGKEAKVDMTTKFPNVRVQATRNTSNGSDSLDISTQLEVIPGEDKLMFAKEAFYSWGITLSVKPRISPDGLINVEIVPTISQLDTACPNTIDGFYAVRGGDSSAYSSFPVIGVKRLTTDFTMKDGSTAVIGGLSKTEEGDIDSGIPYLRKIPWIGPKVFGWKSRGKVQKEVVVFVTVGIADPGDLPKDAGLPKNAVLGRQYVDGTQLEPGDRKDAAATMLQVDKRAVDDPERNDAKADL